MSLSFHSWVSTTTARHEGAQPSGAALLEFRPSSCCCSGAAVETHLVKHPNCCASSPCMIHCCNALVGNRMEQVQEERGSLIWVGAAQPNLVQQWVLHLTSTRVCQITCINLQTISTSVMVKQASKTICHCASQDSQDEYESANAGSHVHPRNQLYNNVQ